MSSERTSSRPVVLITGAAGKGIGTACALLFARKGYDVVVTDVVDASEVKAEVEELGAKCLAIKLDVCNKESVDSGACGADLFMESRPDMVCNSGVADALAAFGQVRLVPNCMEL